MVRRESDGRGTPEHRQTCRRAGSRECWVWRSEGGAGFAIAPATPEEAGRVPRGTEIVLHLKEDAKRYLEDYEI